MKKQLLTGVLIALLGTASLPVAAYEAGDFVLRAGAAGVLPDGDGGTHPTLGPPNAEAEDAWSLGITGTYMFTGNIGVGVLAAWPFEHDIKISGIGKVGETKHLPPTVTLQYHFDTASKVHPYIGAGINYTNFFDEEAVGALSGDSLELDDSWGLAAEVGVDFELNNDWLVSAQAWYLDIDTDTTIAGPTLPASFDVEIDPWVLMFSVGKKF